MVRLSNPPFAPGVHQPQRLMSDLDLVLPRLQRTIQDLEGARRKNEFDINKLGVVRLSSSPDSDRPLTKLTESRICNTPGHFSQPCRTMPSVYPLAQDARISSPTSTRRGSFLRD